MVALSRTILLRVASFFCSYTFLVDKCFFVLVLWHDFQANHDKFIACLVVNQNRDNISAIRVDAW